MIPKISVIIPVYNAENFLTRCLNSVLAQTLSDIEIICIDDYSEDNSFKILENFSVKDKRFKIFKNDENLGQGLTRNRGLDLATGEYIAFVDSDDWIESNMYEVVYNQAITNNYDLVYCGLIYDFSDGKSATPELPSINPELPTIQFLLNEAIAPSLKLFSPNSPCDKIYKRQFIEDLNLRFESERIFLYEDKFFNINFLVANPTYTFIPEIFYHYVVRHGSTMTSHRKNFLKRYFVMDEKLKTILFEGNYLNNELQWRFRRSLFEITFSFCLNALVYNRSIKGKISEFLAILKDDRVSSNIKYFSLKDIPVSASKMNSIVKSICFLILKYLC
ncbi:glycosyltransferase family 2 protein [Flavobacterium piscisymbiosum]|uniref:Glycosyltransferase n=1 Tax=Flavobacterium piscisymbiosum TaxID=2893753 RepID=A0ABS8M8H3_9FLAO|nr:glycosyltransferase [Flavobacterium sp. F-30]